MNIFKKILLSIIVTALIAGSSQAMEKPDIKYSNPINTYSREDFKISAKIGETEIGLIEYILKKRKATILRFEVNENYRNNKEQHIGQHLFQACVNDALAHECIQLEWTANPTSNLDITVICTIYEKMVQKLENSHVYKFTKGKEYDIDKPKVNMKLVFKKR